MKNLFRHTLILSLLLSISIIFCSCGETNGPTVPGSGGNPLTGAYILYYTPATSTDYAYYDAAKDSVTDFLITTNSTGVKLNVNPGEMKLNSDRMLYITTLGIPGNNGTIYKVDPSNNSILDSLRFGSAPDGFVINNNRIVVGNSGSTNVTVLDLDFNIIKDTVEVGSNPANVLYGFNKYIVTRQSLNNEPSVALVDEISYGVTKLFYPGVPVSSIFNVNGIFVSANNTKNIYLIDPGTQTTTDSFAVPTVLSSITRLVSKTQNSFYVVAGAKEVWLASVNSGTISFTNIFQAAADVNIMAMAYESNANELYFTSESNPPGAILFVIDGNSGTIKRFKSLNGNNTQSIVFRYF
jgi:hypothetical protein